MEAESEVNTIAAVLLNILSSCSAARLFASLDLMAPGMLAKMFVAASWGMALGQLRGLSISQNRSNATNVSNATDSDALRSTRGSCQQYGCPSTYIRSQACQCNSRCKDYGNCCSDIASCSAGAPPAEGGSPAARAPMEGVSGHPDPSKSYPSYPGFTLALVEEFDSPLDLDNDPIWTWSDGGLYEGDVRFVKQQVRFEGGKMKISADRNPGYATQACSHAEVGTVDPKPLVSGEFRSRRNIFRYGRYEVRMKAPDVQPGKPDVDGNFVATMSLDSHWKLVFASLNVPWVSLQRLVRSEVGSAIPC